MTLLAALLWSTCGSLLCAWLAAHYAMLAEQGDTQASARNRIRDDRGPLINPSPRTNDPTP